MYTPAVTMVAAWISALTGVGPSIASGSQTYSGICADLPVAPTKQQQAIAVSTPCAAEVSTRHRRRLAEKRSRNRACRTVQNSNRMPMRNPKSPTRFTQNALLPASVARFLQEPEADQQVAAQADAFPADEHQQVVGGQHQRQHEKHEQIQVGRRSGGSRHRRPCSRWNKCESASRRR